MRIHVERAILGPKRYKFLAGEIKISELDLAGKIFAVVFLVVTNFHAPLVNGGDVDH